MRGPMNDDASLIHESLEWAAGAVHDITPLVYERFFRAHPEARELFGPDSGNLIKEVMLVEILEWIGGLAEGRLDAHGALFWGVDHAAFEVTDAMVASMFAAITESVKSCAGGRWTAEMERAWQRQYDALTPWILDGLARGRRITGGR